MGICQITGRSTIEQFKEFLEEQMLTSIYPPPDSQVIKTISQKPTKSALQNTRRISFSAQPLQKFNEMTVNPNDGRSQILATAKWPHSVHGMVSFRMKNTSSWGTGTLIGPNVVLTAGHNLYDCKTKAYVDVKSLQFLPAMNGQELPFGLVDVRQYFVSPNYIKAEKEDYGILILKEPIGEVTGYFGLACLEPEEIKEKEINVTGYPSDKVASKPNSYEMWGMESRCSHVDQRQGIIHHMIDTGAGQSGSGIWFQEGEDYYVCGVHIAGTQIVNKGTLLTRAMYRQIYIWLQQTSPKEPLLKLEEEKELRLKDQRIDTKCLELLMKYNLDSLTCLDLENNQIWYEGALILSENASWVNLSELNLSNTKLDAAGVNLLAQNPYWTSLSKLSLSDNNLGPEGAIALAKNTSWGNLSELVLFNNNIGSKGAKALAQNNYWINLEKLYLVNNNIGVQGTQALAQNHSWKNLSHLFLSFNNIGFLGACMLAQNTSWANLSKLYLSNTNIGTEGAKQLAQNDSWSKLSFLDLCNSHVSKEGIEALKQKWRGLIIQHNIQFLEFEGSGKY